MKPDWLPAFLGIANIALIGAWRLADYADNYLVLVAVGFFCLEYIAIYVSNKYYLNR